MNINTKKVEVYIYLTSLERLRTFLKDYELKKINIIENLDSRIKNHRICFQPTGIFFGQEFCPTLYPRYKEVIEAHEMCNKQGLKFIYVSGLLRKSESLIVFNTCNRLKELGNAEITLNDPGLIAHFTRFSDIKVNVGRLRLKQKRTYFNIPEISNSQKEYFKYIDVDSVLDMCESSPNSLELDMTSYGADLVEGYNYSVYFPYSYLTSMRDCPLRKGPKNLNCQKICKNERILLKRQKDQRFPNEFGLFQYGNTIFFENSPLLREYLSYDKVTRIIYQYGVPI